MAKATALAKKVTEAMEDISNDGRWETAAEIVVTMQGSNGRWQQRVF